MSKKAERLKELVSSKLVRTAAVVQSGPDFRIDLGIEARVESKDVPFKLTYMEYVTTKVTADPKSGRISQIKHMEYGYPISRLEYEEEEEILDYFKILTRTGASMILKAIMPIPVVMETIEGKLHIPSLCRYRRRDDYRLEPGEKPLFECRYGDHDLTKPVGHIATRHIEGLLQDAVARFVMEERAKEVEETIEDLGL